MSVSKTLLPAVFTAASLMLGGFSVCMYLLSREVAANSVSLDLTPDSRAGDTLHLYSAQTAGKRRGYDVVGRDGSMTGHYEDNQDGSQTVDLYQADGKTLAAVTDYHRATDDSGNRLMRGIRRFAGDGVTVFSEKRFRQLDGSQDYDGLLLGDGSYRAFTYFGDGVTPETEKVTKSDSTSADDRRTLLLEQKWLEAGHVLTYSNVLDKDGANRDIKKFDFQGFLTLERHFNIFNTIGASVVAYFPGSNKVAMRSLSDRREDDATFFRENGTVDFTQEITPYCIGVTYFDEQTQKKLFHQVWLTDGPESRTHQPPRLYTVEEFDDKENSTRLLTFSAGVVSRQVLNNLTLEGQLYKIVTLDYDEAGKVRLSALTPAEQNTVIPSAETLRLSSISTHVDDKERSPPNLEYDLPVPTPGRKETE